MNADEENILKCYLAVVSGTERVTVILYIAHSLFLYGDLHLLAEGKIHVNLSHYFLTSPSLR